MASSNLVAATSMLPKVLFSGQLADTTEDTLYTAPSPGSAVLKHGSVCNVSGSSVTFSMSILKSGQATGSAQHRVVSVVPIAAGDTLPLGDVLAGACLGPGDFVTATAGTANALDVVLSGVEST